jgi:hypothetical protein
MPCCGQSTRSGAVTSAEVATADRFKVTRDDGLIETFATYDAANAWRNTNGGHLTAIPQNERTGT